MRTIDLITRFQQQYPQADFPPNFLEFLQEQRERGHPICRAHTQQPLRDFLLGLGVPSTLVDSLLDADSRLVLHIDFPSLLEMSTPELDRFLAKRLANVFTLQEIVLDSETLTGFNRHGREHLRSVTRRMRTLLRYANGNCARGAVEREAIIAGYLHDIGNLLSRKEHGIYGIYLLTKLLTGMDRDPETLASFLRVLEAVLFHEVEYGSRVQSLDVLSPITLSLIVADKTDVNLRRVSSKSNVPEAIRDAHMLVNLLTGDSRLKLGKSGVEWEIHFSPKVKQDDAAQFSALLKRAERFWVPAEWQTLYRRENIEYVFIFHATFLRVYFSRLAFAIRAMFALCSHLQTFRLVVQDDERGVSLTRVFARDDYQTKVNMIANNLFKNMDVQAA